MANKNIMTKIIAMPHYHSKSWLEKVIANQPKKKLKKTGPKKSGKGIQVIKKHNDKILKKW